MKKTVITVRRKRTEIATLLVCFLFSNILNLYSIIAYKTPATELITSMGYVLAMTFTLYTIWSIIRLCMYGIKKISGKKR